MAVRDEDFGSGLTLVEGDDGIWSSPEAAPACAPRDWRSECEREHARAEREWTRADAAEARCEELRWAEVESRARAGSPKWQLDRSRSKLKAAVEETQEVRRTAKDALSLQAEVTRLGKLLSEASIEPTKHRPTSPADKARRRLRATLEQAENQKATIKSLRAERGELRKEVTRLNRELARLGKRLAREEQVSERHKETIRRQYDEDIQLRAALRRLRNQSDILALIRRRLPLDWAERYNTTPVLIETFVETPRYTGAVYKASGWIHVGTTQGRGRYDRDKLYDKPRKDIWLRPLRKDWKRALNR